MQGTLYNTARIMSSVVPVRTADEPTPHQEGEHVQIKTNILGLCTGEIVTTAGKRFQFLKMLILILCPVLLLMGMTTYFLNQSVADRHDLNQKFSTISESRELGRLIRVLQRERDQSTLYISKLGAETKIFLLKRYSETDDLLEMLSVWPVNLDKNKRSFFQSNQAFQRYLVTHRQEILLSNPTVVNEIVFYTDIISVFLKWLSDSITESRIGATWKLVVSYQKLIRAAEDVGIERALGGSYLARGSFQERDTYIWFNQVIHTSNYSYNSAQLFSPTVKSIEEYVDTSKHQVVNNVEDYREKIRSLAYYNSSDLQEASLYFDNMTIYIDTLFDIQQILASEISANLNSKINTATLNITVWSVIIAMVVGLCPVQIYWIYMQLNNIQHYGMQLVTKNDELGNEKKRGESLLLQMLPKEVLYQLKNSSKFNAKYYKDVTIFFSTVDRFAKISMKLTPINVVNLLDKIYCLFDSKIEKYDVYKVETIGDQYMVVSGLPVLNTKRHCIEIADMSLDLLESCNKLNSGLLTHGDNTIKIRIGIHSGSAMAGVVGIQMPRFCVFGDSVNTASRMESNGMANRIHLSHVTQKLLLTTSEYKFQHRGNVFIKGKGDMETYWLTGKTTRKSPDFRTPEPKYYSDDHIAGHTFSLTPCTSRAEETISVLGSISDDECPSEMFPEILSYGIQQVPESNE